MTRIKTFLSISFIIFLATGLISCGQGGGTLPSDLVRNPKSAGGEQNISMPEITFAKTEHDFGRLIQGEQVVYVFKFTNTGSSDLLVSKVSASCGCTASKYTREPVKPGSEGKIEVTFDSNGQRGIQNKTITVLTNGKPQTTVLRIKAQVVTPDAL
ncbi:MAG TPA: DUF1573 domain-containing protein [Bacteroidales bacterium]|nr:DUF1573 domain-containing protein [Bacteroidales bacterium]